MPTDSPSAVLLRLRRLGPTAADELLLAHFVRTGEPETFAALVRRHGPMVRGVCRRLLRQAADADDAFQATFLVLFQKAASLDRPHRLGPWLHGVARRTALKARTMARRRGGPPLDDVAAPPTVDEVVWRDLRPTLDDAVRSLPDRYRTPFHLCYLDGLTIAEAARQVGCPPGTVATHLSRARDLLRARLTRRGVTLSSAALAAVLSAGAATAAVPSALVQATVAAASGAASLPVRTLVQGVCRTMLLAKLCRVGTGVMALLTAVAVVAGLTAGGREGSQTVAPTIAFQAPAAPDDAEEADAVTTKNFVVTAPTRRVARLVADAAERHRKTIAVAWLGKELPAWKEPCPVRVRITLGSSGSSSTFQFGDDRVASRSVHLEGPLDGILANTLPHELTHSVLADHFGRPLPRWADEGAALQAEDEREQRRHADLFLEVVDRGRLIPLSRLLGLHEYPDDVMALYAEGHSLTQFLLRRGRPTFLAFVKQGLIDDWKTAASEQYGYADVAAMEKDWLTATLKNAPRPPMPAAKEGRPPTLVTERVPPVPGLAWVDDQGKSAVVEFLAPKVVPNIGLCYIQIRVQVLLPAAEVYTLDGLRLDARQLPELLKKETPVLVAIGGRKVDPFFLKVVKEGTLIVVVPLDNSPTPPVTPAEEQRLRQ